MSKIYGLPPTISTSFKNAGSVKKQSEIALTNCKRSDIDTLKHKTSHGIPISAPVLKVQAERFAVQLDYKDFVTMDGQIALKSKQILYRKISEASLVDKTVVNDWLKVCGQI